MELAAICVVLVTCLALVVMVAGRAVSEHRRGGMVDVVDRLGPWEDVTVVDLREPTGAERYFADRLRDPVYAAAYWAARDESDLSDGELAVMWDEGSPVDG